VNIVPTSRTEFSRVHQEDDGQAETHPGRNSPDRPGHLKENLTDIELAAFVTSSYIHGMTSDEIEWMTRAMIDTGEKIEFDTHPIMDKHSIAGSGK